MDSLEELRVGYEQRLPTFQRAATNIQEAIQLLLESSDLTPLAVLSRVKSFDSFLEKIERKSYKNPFEETTDFIGIRVILYLPSDIPKVVGLMKKEFHIIESDDKRNLLDTNEFGYLSHHLVIKIINEWARTPNYKNLENISIEIQLRTVMMHAWAEIEHKLQYKSKDQVPKDLQRKLFLLSAKVEEADGQFESLVNEVFTYRQSIVQKTAADGEFDLSLELNLDTFKELIIYSYPNKEFHDGIAQNVYESVVKKGLTLKEVSVAINQLKPLEDKLSSMIGGGTTPLSAAGYLGYALELFVAGFDNQKNNSSSRNKVINNLKALQKINN